MFLISNSLSGVCPDCCVVSFLAPTYLVAVAYKSRETDTVRGTARRPHFSLAIISVTVQFRV